jgi:hypothetical protein
MTAQRITYPDVFIDADTIQGDGTIGNPLHATGTTGGDTVDAQQLVITPTEPEPYGPGANMPPGIIDNWTQPGLADHTNLEWRGADNQATVLLSIDSTGIAEGAIRIFNNATLSPADAGSVILVDESDPRVIAAGAAAPDADRICTPTLQEHKVNPQGTCVLQRRRRADGAIRWVVLNGASKQLWMYLQGLALYPHLQVGTPGVPIVGAQQDWNPVGVPIGGNPDNLTVDGGNAADARMFTFWNVWTDAAGASVGGFLGTAVNSAPTDWGPVRFVYNSGPGDLTFVDHDAGSNAENQLALPYARNYVLPVNQGAWFIRPFLDEGMGVTVGWRMMGVSNEQFPSLNTLGRTTTVQLQLGAEDTINLAAGLNTDISPGTDAVIRMVGAAPCSLVESMEPSRATADAPNEIRFIKNCGAVPIVLVPALSASGGADPDWLFQTPALVSVANSSPPVIIMPNQEVALQFGSNLDGGGWKVLGAVSILPTNNAGESISPAAFGAGAVNDYAPVDAVTGLQGRFAPVWRVQGAVGTQLTGIDATPAGLPPFVHNDRILLINYAAAFLLMSGSVLSAPGNRMVCPAGGANTPDYTLLTNGSVWLVYDGFNLTWVIEGAIV